jgi:hypothetical protein
VSSIAEPAAPGVPKLAGVGVDVGDGVVRPLALLLEPHAASGAASATMNRPQMNPRDVICGGVALRVVRFISGIPPA